MSMIIEGEKAMAFSGSTIELPRYGDDYSLALIEYSRRHYTVGRGYIETFMHDRYTEEQASLNAQTDMATKVEGIKPKRKHTRSHNKPKPKPPVSQTNQQAVENETVLYLR